MSLPFGFFLKIEFNGSFFPFLGLTLLMFLFVFLSNRRNASTSGQLGQWQYRFILLFRIVAVFLMLLLVFNPQISLNRVQSLPKRVAVVLDQSQSMLRSWEGTPDDLETAISRIISSLDQNYPIDLWSMDGQRIERGVLGFTKPVSMFSWHPGDEQNIYQAAFIISDGQLNGGRSPLDQPWSKSIPLYPVLPLVSRTNTLLDFVRLEYVSPDENDRFTQIKMKIQAEGLTGQTVSIIIRNKLNKILGEQSLRLDQRFTDVTIPVELIGSGSRDLNISVSLEKSHLTTEQLLHIELKKPLKNVLLVSERVNTLHRFLLLNLPDSLYQVYSLLGTETEQQRSRKLATLPKDIDLIILNQPGNRVNSDEARQLIAAELEASCPLIIFQNSTDPLDPNWLTLLKVKQHLRTANPAEYLAMWSETASAHPFYLGLRGRGYSPIEILKYPPLIQGPVFLEISGEELLSAGSGDYHRPALQVRDNPPQACFTGVGYWKWFFQPQSQQSFQQIWAYLLVYLDENSDAKPVTIDVPLQSVSTGAVVEVGVQVQDLDHRAITDSEVRVWREDLDGYQDVLDLTQGKNEYSSSFIAKRTGETRIIAEAYRFGELWGRDTSTIHVVTYNGEYQSDGVDQVFLGRLARRSGGQIVDFQKTDLPVFPMESFIQRTSHELQGLRSTGLFVILLTLLVLEWILRRRNGLL